MKSYIQLWKKVIRHRHHLHPAISVIIPFFNAENTLERCLSSVVNGTHIPCEIILVNDGSTDQSMSIAKRYSLVYRCIRLINHTRNQGLYLARLHGLQEIRGNYVGFVDSDDVVSDGYFDRLYEAARDKRSDIAVGQIINRDIYGANYLQTRCAVFPYFREGESWGGRSLTDLYWNQKGRCYHFHVVWNKIYRMSVIKSALPYLRSFSLHQVMLEDFIISSIIFSVVHSSVTVTEARYFYCQKPIQMRGRGEVEKDICDVINAFSFVEAFLKKKGLEGYLGSFYDWRALYGRIWKRIILEKCSDTLEQKELLSMMKAFFGTSIGMVSQEDEYYYHEVIPC